MGVVKDFSETIDGVTYTTRLFPATEGIEIGRMLFRLIDENAVGQALLTVELDKLEEILSDPHFILMLLTHAAKSSEAGEVSALLRALVTYTTADKVKIGDAEVNGSVHKHFDTHFAGRYAHLLEVCVFAARLGFAGP